MPRRVGVGTCAQPVPVGKVGRGGPHLGAVEQPVVAVALGAQLHVGRVAAGLGLAVAHRELDLAADDLRQETLFHLVAAVADDGLAHHAHALARLRQAAPRQRLGEYEIVDARQRRTAVLDRPRHAQPAALGQRGNELALGRAVDRLRELLGVTVAHRRAARGIGQVLVEELLNLGREGQFFFTVREVHVA